MSKQRTRRRRTRCAVARAIAVGGAIVTLVATLGAGQALASTAPPDERVLERQGRIANQADAQGGADAPAGQETEWTRKRFTKPEPKVNPGPWVDEAPAPPAPAPEADRPNLAVPATAAVLLVLALGAATWWLRHRRPPPEPTT